MTSEELTNSAKQINRVVSIYFQEHPDETEVKPADLMPALVAAGIFLKDHRKGLPLRNLLRGLDDQHLLHLLPLLRVERKQKNRLWFFTTARHHR